MTGHIYRGVILEQHARLFRGARGAEFLFMEENARLHRTNIVDECLQSEDITSLFSYTRAFGDVPRNFEPWSSDVDDT
ncbi:DDE_3 domain-containing protein [Trichonephila clavipes]|nr:DDE_3 domain-containing protein [Trichonephila clavipes]